MKQQPKLDILQMNLPLLDLATAELPPDKQRDLALVLAEMLLNAANTSGVRLSRGGEDDQPEAHR